LRSAEEEIEGLTDARAPHDPEVAALPHPFFRSAERPGHPRVSPGELDRLMTAEPRPVLLDVRPAAERAIAHLEGDRWIPFDDLPSRTTELPSTGPILLYCHYGGTAHRAADLLRGAGRTDVAVLEGGIDEYARVVEPSIPRYRDPPNDGWLLQQFPNRETGCLAYLVHDRASDEAIVIDPGSDVAPYLAALRERRLKLRAILETHTHADHLSGHAELHARTSAPVWLGRRSPAQYPHSALAQGDGVSFGRSELLVSETPGHTSDHLSLRIDGAVFTGDTLLPGSCGRTDLGDGSPDQLWESLTTKLLTLADDTEVFPAHYGPRHGLPPPERYASTIGFERRTNEALVQPNREAFVRYMTDGWPPKPADCDSIVRSNLLG
jgi:glyoxylase-like metal-dependent hydrolase (beta-lactamase superfamily II)